VTFPNNHLLPKRKRAQRYPWYAHWGTLPRAIISLHSLKKTYPIDIVEITIRFILVLFLEFVGIERFVVEFLGREVVQSTSFPSCFHMRTSSYMLILYYLSSTYPWKDHSPQQRDAPPRGKGLRHLPDQTDACGLRLS